ncbi:MAG: manganese efflux pump [Lachnospiraceae bacterium]|nr:manganese efflux pump [Lachnospiraceae bacterium]
MSLWQLIVISVGLSLDVFAYCLYKGAMISEIKKKAAALIILFTAFQTVMMIAGNALTRFTGVQNTVTSARRFWIFVAAVVFLCLGIYMILKAVRNDKKKVEEKKQDEYEYRVILLWALITSIDALAAGIGFGFLGLALVGTALVIGINTAISAAAGLIAGYWLGCGPRNKCVIVGGCLVLVGAAKLFVNYVGMPV